MGDKGEEEFFTSLKEVSEEAKKGSLILLYLFNKRDTKKLETFEKNIFNNEEIALGAKLFTCLRFNLGIDPKEYQEQIKNSPRFLFIGDDNKIWENVSLQGYKARASSVFKAMEGVIKKKSKVDIKAFTKEEKKLLADYDAIETKKKLVGERLTKSKIKSKGKETSEILKLKKEEEALKKREEEVREKEKKLVAQLGLKIDLEKQ